MGIDTDINEPTSAKKTDEVSFDTKNSRKYLAFLAIVIFFGWALVNFDANLVILLSTPILSALHLSVQQYSYILSAGFGASFVVSLLLGPLGDKYGRRLLLQISLLGVAIFSPLQYFITGFTSWFAIRLGAGSFFGVEWGSGATVLAETFGKRIRGVVLSVMQSGWVVGYGLAALVALFAIDTFGPTNGWRYAFLFALVPAVVLVLARFALKKTERFEHQREVLNAIEKKDKERLEKLLSIHKVDVEKVGKSHYKQLFEPDVRRTTTSVAFWSFMLTGVAITIVSFAPVYYVDVRHFSFSQVTSMLAVASFLGVIGYILNGVLADIIGAKYSAMIFAAIGVIFLYINVFHTGTNFSAVYITYIILVLGHSGSFSSMIKLNTEAFPTRIRATGSIWGGAFWGLGQSIWPLLFGTMLASISFQRAWLLIEIIPLSLAIVVFMFLKKNIPPKKELEEIAI